MLRNKNKIKKINNDGFIFFCCGNLLMKVGTFLRVKQKEKKLGSLCNCALEEFGIFWGQVGDFVVAFTDLETAKVAALVLHYLSYFSVGDVRVCAIDISIITCNLYTKLY